MFVYLRLTGLKMFQIFSWLSHRGHRELGGADVGLPASVQLPSAMRAFFQGGGFKGTKNYATGIHLLGMGRCLTIRMSFLG